MVKKEIISKAIAATYVEMRDTLLAIFRQVGLPEEECEDLVQDAFERLLAVDLLREDTIRGMVATIAYRLRTDILRHRAFVRMARERMTVDSIERTTADTACIVHDLQRIEKCIVAKMPQATQQVYELARFCDKGNEEIADLLNMTYRAVESRLYRSRMEVRQQFKRLATA
jgi:RNA polymerase sigma factor (sigma-70 family)